MLVSPQEIHEIDFLLTLLKKFIVGRQYFESFFKVINLTFFQNNCGLRSKKKVKFFFLNKVKKKSDFKNFLREKLAWLPPYFISD